MPPTFQRLIALVSLGLLLGACSSSGTASEAATRGSPPSILVVLHDYKTGQRLELASESHTSRVEYYSTPRTDAARKVQTDEVMSALLSQLDEHGFARHGRAGRAPTLPSGVQTGPLRWGLELERDGEHAHWLVGTGSAAGDWQDFQECRDSFLQLYNITVSFQAVENESGREFFRENQPRPAVERQR